MIRGIGTDIVEIERIEKAQERHPHFKEKILTPNEQRESQNRADFSTYLAGRFAAKEALVKALGTGIGPVSWQEIEILNEVSGLPRISLHGKALAYQREAGGGKFFISISHEKKFATAMVVWEVF